MIVLDADVVLTDYRYQRDARFPVTRQVLDSIRASGKLQAITTQALLEVVGVLSFNVAGRLVESLPVAIQTQYQLTIIPGLHAAPDYAGCSIDEIVHQMREKMGLGDAVLATQIRKFAPPDSILLTWNAKHFRGKTTFPVLTPEEWLLQHPPAGPTP